YLQTLLIVMDYKIKFEITTLVTTTILEEIIAILSKTGLEHPLHAHRGIGHRHRRCRAASGSSRCTLISSSFLKQPKNKD
ncbi:MAG: hypothetical protein AAGJ31_03240, partial [Verrucomicrobiota bacterium]